MRARFLNKIKGQNQVKVESLTKRVICSLFLDFLKQEHFHYTPTVFVPECGSNQMTLSRQELQEYLKIPNLENESVLEFLIGKYRYSVELRGVSETYVQTEESQVTGLETRLQQLDHEFLKKTRDNCQNIDEKVLRVRKECEEKARTELEYEIKRVKEVEVAQVRIEEASKYREQLKMVRGELEEHWRQQIEELKLREKENKDRILVREKDLELREFRQRDLFEKELEILKTKEKDMKKAAEIELESAKLQKKSWEQKKNEYETKLKEMESFKSTMSTKAIDDFNQYKRHFEAQFDEEKRKLFNEKFELQANRESFSLEVEKVKRTEEKLKEQLKELSETRQKLDFFQSNYEKTMKELERTREELRFLSETSKRDLDLLAFKEQELQAVKNECKAFKDLYNDQKESMKMLETTNQAIVSKIMNEEQAKIKASLESDYLAERQMLWRQIDKESTGIRKEMNDLITGQNSAKTVFKSSVQPTYKTFVSVESKFATQQVKYKTLNENQIEDPDNQEEVKVIPESKPYSQSLNQKSIKQPSPIIPQPTELAKPANKSAVLIEHEESESYKSSARKIENIDESIQESISEYESQSEQSIKFKTITAAAPSAKPGKIEFSESSSHEHPIESQESSNSDEYF